MRLEIKSDIFLNKATEKIWINILYMIILGANFSVHKSLSHSFFCCLMSFKIKVIEVFSCIKNIPMLNMFTFDVFSACHSLSQSVTGVTLLHFDF